MRVGIAMLGLAICASAAPAGPAQIGTVQVPQAARPFAPPTADNCPRATSYFAGRGSSYRGDQLTPKNLAELPPAVGYMAVYRTRDGCEDPMTVAEYRTGRKP